MRPAPGSEAEGRHPIQRRSDLGPDDAAAVADLVAEAAAHDGFAPLNEQALLHLRHPQPGSAWHLLGRDGDRLVGYAHLDLSAGGPVQAECVVAPGHRRQGWGRALVSAALDMTTPRRMQLWSHGDSPAAARLAESLGFSRVRELWQMRRPLDGLPDPPELPGVEIRTFRPGQDDAAWLALNARAFADHPEQGRMTQRDLELRMSESWFYPAGFFLAERDGQPVGFHWTKEHGDVGEVYVIGVDPAAQGTGLGRLLTLVGLHHLRNRGLNSVLLYVESDNQAAIATYQRLGFQRVGVDALYRIR